jgi:hypothetical protein
VALTLKRAPTLRTNLADAGEGYRCPFLAQFPNDSGANPGHNCDLTLETILNCCSCQH